MYIVHISFFMHETQQLKERAQVCNEHTTSWGTGVGEDRDELLLHEII